MRMEGERGEVGGGRRYTLCIPVLGAESVVASLGVPDDCRVGGKRRYVGMF